MTESNNPFETIIEQDDDNPHYITTPTHLGGLVLDLPVVNPDYKNPSVISNDDLTSID